MAAAAHPRVRPRAAFFELLPRTTGAAAALAAGHDDRLSGDDRTWLRVGGDRPLRHALEVRHASFGEAGSRLVDLLTEHHIAFVVADTAGSWPFLDHLTSDIVYAGHPGTDVRRPVQAARAMR